ncbi:AAA family ATPase [Streptomyces scabiei]|uniref:AAA family ATPase n=1 Tax=Streptomyces scabiei TaxID=1930 RepID=UPI000765B4AF|nr:AAA family ATPase [Streptomyces scabiei]
MDNVRHMPHDQADSRGPERYDAERHVLGGCMHHPRDIPTVRAVITRSDFALPQHELIWDVIGHLHDNGQPLSPLSIRLELEKRQELRRAGGLTYINQLGDYALDPEYHAHIVRRDADLRTEADLGRRIMQQATAPDAEPGRAVTFIDDYLQRQKERAAGRSGDPADALLAELLDASSLDNMPTLEPLVGDLLHLDSLARIIGPSGHMKSFVTIDLAGHVGTGMPWHGHYVRQGTVVYLVAEGARGIRKRVRAWEKHYGLKMDNVLFLPRPVQTTGPEWDTLIEAMRRLEPAFIIIDTQARVSVGVEENSAKELGIVVDRIEDLRRNTGSCVLVVHHTGHVGEHGRGSTSAKGALQSELHVSKKGDSAANIVVTVKTGKQKDDEEGPDVQFGLKVVTLDGEAKPDGRPVTSVVLESLDHVDPAKVPGSAEWIAARLDAAGVPSSYGRDRLRSECTRLEISVRNDLLADVARIRKARGQVADRSDQQFSQTPLVDTASRQPQGAANPDNTGQDSSRNLSPDLSPTQNAQPVPKIRTGAAETPGQTCPGQVGDSTGQAEAGPVPKSPSLEGGQGDGQPAPDAPDCTVCHTPLHGYRLDRGYTTCLACDPETGSHPDRPTHPAA